MKYLDSEKKEQFDMMLNEPFDGRGEQFSDEQAGEDFMAAMGTLGAVS